MCPFGKRTIPSSMRDRQLGCTPVHKYLTIKMVHETEVRSQDVNRQVKKEDTRRAAG